VFQNNFPSGSNKASVTKHLNHETRTDEKKSHKTNQEAVTMNLKTEVWCEKENYKRIKYQDLISIWK
jgi:hypothetical protein